MTTLTEFIAARLDEDEASATAAADSGRWYIDVDGNVQDEDTHGGGSAYVAVGPWDGGIDDACAAHIVRHDPARVLREVDAKRKILTEIVPLVDSMDSWIQESMGAHDAPPLGESEALLRILAAAWSDHPDYDQGWRP